MYLIPLLPHKRFYTHQIYYFMRLYEDSSIQLIEDIKNNTLPLKIEKSFVEYYGHKPSAGQFTSWNNSFQFVKNELECKSPVRLNTGN